VTATDTGADAAAFASDVGSDVVERSHLGVAALFLLAGGAAYLGVSAKLVWPAFLADTAAFSYGRLFPAATNALLYGWLMLAFLAAAHHIVPRAAGVPLRSVPAALSSLLLIGGGVGAGIIAVGAGHNAGGRYLELPLWADAAVGLGLVVAAATLTATARAGKHDRAPLPVWYLVAGSWWLVSSWVIGALDVGGGVPSAIQGWFAVTAFTGLWPAAAGIGAGYYLVGRLVPGVVFHPRLGRIGFWSLAFAWVWTAGRHLQYGPTPDWAETIPVVFAAGLVVAVVTVVTDFVSALRGRWETVRSSIPLRFFAVGLALFVLVPFQVMVSSLRGVSSIVHFTAWESAYEQLMLFGPFTFWAIAVATHVLPAPSRGWGRRVGGVTLVVALAGLATALVSRWVAGLQQGYTWVAGVQSREFANVGDGFRNSLEPIEGLQVAQFVGLGMVVVALVLFVAGVLRHGASRAGASSTPLSLEMPTAPLRGVLQGALALFVVGGIAVALLPALESDEPASALAAATRSYPVSSSEARGAELYVAEGCWYCHTQQVRPIVTDIGLGPVSVAGDYVYDDVDLLGLERIGPDIAHAGTRFPTEDVTWNVRHLQDPRSVRPWSTMPRYAHLDDDDLAALAAYVASLD
jgi:cbb3-type cytochrome oxidase subunit 1